MTFPVGFRSEMARPVVPMISLLSRLSIFPSLEDLRTSPFAHGNLSKYLSQIPTDMTVTSRTRVDRRTLPPNPRKTGGRSSALNTVTIPNSKFRVKIADVLKKEGFIIDYKVNENEGNKPDLEINLKYNYGSPVISTIERVSKPGRRIFSSAESLPKINNGLGIAIISTPKGVMTDVDARKQKVGGEIICKVF